MTTPEGPASLASPGEQATVVTVAEAQALWAAWTLMERRLIANWVARRLMGWDSVLSGSLEAYTTDGVAAQRLLAAGLAEVAPEEVSVRDYWVRVSAIPIPETALELWPTQRLYSVVVALLSGTTCDFNAIESYHWVHRPHVFLSEAPS